MFGEPSTLASRLNVVKALECFEHALTQHYIIQSCRACAS